MGPHTCGCTFEPGEPRACRGHKIPRRTPLPKLGKRLLTRSRQPAEGIVAELEAWGRLVGPKRAAELELLERRRAKFRRQLRPRPHVMQVPRNHEGLVIMPPGGAASTVKGLGLNAAQLYACPDDDFTKFGPLAGQSYDYPAVGASVLRQLGTRDLLWQFLVDREAAKRHGLVDGRAVKVPFEADSTGTWYEAGDVLDELILSSDNVERFAELLSLLEERGLKAVFTFLTLGGGAQPIEADATAVVSGVSYVIRDPAPMRWAEGHAGRALADGSAFGYRDGGGAFDQTSLDPGSAYKRAVMAAIGERAIELLVRAMDHAFGENRTVVLGDLVAGVEIFNEVGVRDWYLVDWHTTGDPEDALVSAELSGVAWGSAWFEVARAMWLAFGTLEADRDRVDLLLPGIESWQVWEGDHFPLSWQYKKDLLTVMLDEIQRLSSEWESAGDAPTGAFEQLVGGVDLHWYHKQIPGLDTVFTDPVSTDPVQQQGYCHIGFLVMELAELRELLDGAPYGLTEASISVFESGMSTSLVNEHFRDADTSDADNRVVAHDFIPTEYASEETAWQGLEVWRRLCGALAGPADAAGWHSWMSGESDTFQGMGLRLDAQPDEDGVWAPTPSDADSTLAVNRPGWWCYRRLAEAIGGSVNEGRMILPAVATRDELHALVFDGSAWEDGDSAVVFEFDLADGRFAYLAFVEPSFLVGPKVSSAFVPAHLVSGTVSVRFRPLRFGRVLVRLSRVLPKTDHTMILPWASATSDCGAMHLRRFVPGFEDESSFTVFPRATHTITFDTASLMDLSPVLVIADGRLRWST